MVNKTISLSEEIIEKLREETNASALIEALLRSHYAIIPEAAIKQAEIIVSKKEEIKKWAEDFRKANHDHGRLTDQEIDAWVENGSDRIKIKWREVKDLEK